MKYDFQRMIDETKWVEDPFMRKYRSHDYPSMIEEFEVSDKEKLVLNPTISVCVLVYNKKAFLRECVKSILAQKTDCDVEVILSDDYSTDGSRKLCEELQREFPCQVRYIYASANVGVMKNLLRAVKYCRGEFVSCVDGDDYFRLYDHLQRQVEFLREHLDYSMSYSASCQQYEKVSWLKVPLSSKTIRNREKMEQLNPRDFAAELFCTNPIAALSVVARCSAMRYASRQISELYQYVDWFPSQDFEAWFFIALKGRVHFDRRAAAVYRMTNTSLTAATQSVARAREVGDMRNRLSILCHLGDCDITSSIEDRVKEGFLSCLQRLCAVTGRIGSPMPYVVSLKPELFSVASLSVVAEREKTKVWRWRFRRSPFYYLIKMIGVRFLGSFRR